MSGIRGGRELNWRLQATFVVRTAALGSAAIDSLSTPRAAQLIADVTALRAGLLIQAEHMSRVLYDVVPKIDDSHQRRVVLNARRSVHAGRHLSADAVEAILEAGGEPALVRGWNDAVEQIVRLDKDYIGALNADLQEARPRLRSFARTGPTASGMAISSPSLAEGITEYIANEAPPADKRQRDVERALISYVYRAATKTTPFSSFATVSIASFGETPSMHGVVQTRRSRLSAAIVNAAISDIASDDIVRRQLLLALPTDLFAESSTQVRFTRRIPRNGATPEEELVYLRRTRTLDSVIDALSEAYVSTDALAQQVRATTEAGPDDIERYLQSLVDLGFLAYPELHVSPYSYFPIHEFVARLEARGVSVDKRAHAYVELESHATAVGQGPESARSRTVAAIVSAADEYWDRATIEFERRTTYIYEDVADTTTGTHLTLADAQRLERPLRALSEVAAVLDPLQPHRLLMKSYFVSRFGIGGHATDIGKFFADFRRDVYDDFVVYELGGGAPLEFAPFGQFEDSGLAKYANARRQVENVLSRAWEESRSREVRIDSTQLVAWDEWPQARRWLDTATTNHYLNVSYGTSAQPEFVWGRCYGAMGLPVSRFASLLAERNGFENYTMRSENDILYCEVTGGAVTSNLNFHPPMTDYRLICPGDPLVIHESAPLSISPADVLIVHDVERDVLQLRHRSTGQLIQPVYLGYRIPLVLPASSRMTLLFAPPSNVTIDFHSFDTDAFAIGRHHRVTIDDVILARNEWRFSGAELPPRTRDYADTYRAWREWQLESRVPDEAFLSWPRSVGEGKPRYIDFRSALSVQAIVSGLDKDVPVVSFAEALPSPSSGSEGASRPNASELVVSLHRRKN